MEIEVTQPYIPHLGRVCHNSKVITINTVTGDYITILVSVLQRGGVNGSEQSLYKSSMAIGVHLTGGMVLIKNRYGCDGIMDEIIIRQKIIESMLSIGFTHLQSSRIVNKFNECVTELTGETTYYTVEYPYGVSYRRYQSDTYHKKQWIKKCNIKTHRMLG
jgi:hypothetical protein